MKLHWFQVSGFSKGDVTMEIMKDFGKSEKEKKGKLEKRSDWVEEVMKASTNPRFKSNAEALAVLTKEFEELASKMGFPSTKELWETAEHSLEFKEEYSQALHLQGQISYLKSHQEK